MESRSLTEIVLEQAINKDLLFYDKLAFFEKELELIIDLNIRKFVEFILIKSDPFWASPSSLIPQQHPADEYGPTGMALHTKRVVKILAITTQSIKLTEVELDCLLAAAFLHDISKAIWKSENHNDVVHDDFHPYTVEGLIKWCLAMADTELNRTTSPADIDSDNLELILRLIRCSHGVWSIVPETIPNTSLELLLHNADTVASNLHFIVEANTDYDQ